jgi:hypothetical protein
MKLYMFRTVRLPIIRSLFIVHSAMVYVTQALYTQLSRRTRMALQSDCYQSAYLIARCPSVDVLLHNCSLSVHIYTHCKNNCWCW